MVNPVGIKWRLSIILEEYTYWLLDAQSRVILYIFYFMQGVGKGLTSKLHLMLAELGV